MFGFLDLTPLRVLQRLPKPCPGPAPRWGWHRSLLSAQNEVSGCSGPSQHPLLMEVPRALNWDSKVFHGVGSEASLSLRIRTLRC